MGQVCPCPCPKRKKPQFAYDVHEETFQMDENIGDLQASPKSAAHGSAFDAASDSNMIDQNQSSQAGQEKIFVQLKNKDEGELSENKSYKNSDEPHNQEKISIQPEEEEGNQILLSQQQEREVLSASNSKLSEEVEVKKIQAVQMPQPIVEEKPQQQKKVDLSSHILNAKPIKKKVNLDDYRFLNENNSTRVKTVDSLKMQQFNIDNCHGCTYFIFDATGSLYIDNSDDCFVFIAPCEGSVFIRSCKNLHIVAACKQFRTYNCQSCTFSLYCKSQPVIESSSELSFSPFESPIYPQLSVQFSKTRLEIWNNHWSEVHNFTKKQDQNDYELQRTVKHDKQVPWKQAFTDAGLEMLAETSLVPFIKGDFDMDIKFEKLAVIIFDKNISKDNQEILKLLPYTDVSEKDLLVLKANHNKIPGMGKDPIVAILIAYDSDDLVAQLGDSAKVFTSHEEVKDYTAKCFVSFTDER